MGFVILLVAAGAVLSLSWTVPLTILAGQGIARERVTQTWDTLLITPFDTESILLAKAASSVRNVWSLVMGLAFFGTLLALFFVSPVVASMGSQINQSLVIGILLMVVGMVAIVLEHAQEIALSVVLGIFVALKTDSQRMALLRGLGGRLPDPRRAAFLDLPHCASHHVAQFAKHHRDELLSQGQPPFSPCCRWPPL